TGTRRAVAAERRARQRKASGATGHHAAIGLEALQPRLVLVHLHVLALAAVLLDEVAFPLDRTGLRLDVLRRTLVALHPLAVIGGVVAAERGQPAIAQLPDSGGRRIQERPVVRGDDEGA